MTAFIDRIRRDFLGRLLSPSARPGESESPPRPVETANSAWRYRTLRDELRQRDIAVAELASDNAIVGARGPERIMLVIRIKDGQQEVLFASENAAFLYFFDGHDPYPPPILARPANSDIREWSLTPASSRNEKAVFVKHARAFVRALAVSRDLWVEVQFVKLGRLQLRFETAGLDPRFIL
jgi:hypothetical protein